MDIFEFLAKLQQTDRTWRLDDCGNQPGAAERFNLIRNASGQCPLEAVAGYSTGLSGVAAAELGLVGDTATVIVTNADYADCCHPESEKCWTKQHIRQTLLNACGIG